MKRSTFRRISSLFIYDAQKRLVDKKVFVPCGSGDDGVVCGGIE